MFLQKQNISNTKHLLKKSHPIENNNIELKKIYNKIHKQMNKSNDTLNKLAIIVETFLLVIIVSKFRVT